MSEALDRGSVVQLIAAINRLTLAVDNLSHRLVDSPAAPSTTPAAAAAPCSSWSTVDPEWELVEEESAALEQESAIYIHQLLLTHGLETGPPALPKPCRDLAVQRLQGTQALCIRRAEVAFACGFWARVAIETNTRTFNGKSQDFAIRPKHWIVLRGGKFGPVRFVDATSYNKGIDLWDAEVIAESFGSLVEIRIFCAGASRPVPPLRRWKK